MSGRFPFGQPSGRCKPRRATKAKAFVLGVYPSALHVRWSGPGVRISYLAIDQEPWPFWDGHDEAQRVAKWRRDVEWQDAWGTATPPGKLNGSSGHKLRDHYLAPLGLNTDDVWLTDCLPFFHVWRGPGTQGAAMRERYDPFALQHQPLRTHELPDRPPAAQLIRRTSPVKPAGFWGNSTTRRHPCSSPSATSHSLSSGSYSTRRCQPS